MGNIKFDVEPDRRSLRKAGRFAMNYSAIVLSGSPPALMRARNNWFSKCIASCAQHPELLLVLVPRHPERFPRSES